MRLIAVLMLLVTCLDPSNCLYRNITIPELPVDGLDAEEESEQEQLSSQLEEVDMRSNGWSEWSEWSPCSRSCDGGASRQVRTCTGGKCRGEHVQYRICNMQPCPEQRDFRASQCAAFDAVPYESTLYSWQPHYDDATEASGADVCTLMCKGRPRDATDATGDGDGDGGTREYVMVVARLADKVHDGTRCRPGSLDMCIDGHCRRIGCDLRIDSTKQVDECGVCGGDGSSCSRPLYHWALTSSSLCSATCGGGYKMSRPVCKNRVTGDEVEEELCNDSQKPQSTVVECNVHNCPPKWFTEEWGPCTVSCGGGTRIRDVYCVEESNNTRIKVDDIRCGGHKPWFQDTCNQMDCPSWFTTKWSGCSVSCGEGVQSRTVECRDSRHQLSDLCPSSSKPTSTKPCSTGIHCPFSMEASEELLLPGLYHTQPLVQPYPPPPVPERLIGEQNVPTEARFIPDEWGPCSVTCGEGIKKRNVFCKIFLEFSRTIAKLPDKQCSGPKPVEEEKCFMDHCDVADKMGVDVKDDPYTRSKIKIASGSPAKSYSWREQGYTHCSATCLGGIQEMIVNCVRDDTQKVTSPYMCPIELKPEIKIQTCNEHPCPPRWNYSEFSQCSQSCGLGIQTREVNCIHEVAQGGGNALIVPNNMCPQPPPPDRQYCNVLDCPVRWKVQEWSRCSKSCGGGQKTRKVECKQVMAQNHTVDRPPAMCPQPKPAETKPCNTKSCVVDSDRPHIDVSNSTFIQHDFKKKKISLRIGGAATVFVGTTIKIKCPVKRFDRAKIQWLKDKTNLPRAKKYKVSKKGALRVSNLGFKDGGLYTCVAGKSSANIAISVRAKPGEMGAGESSKQSGTEEGSTSGKKKAGTKTRLFTPTLPSLRLDTSLDEQSTLNKNEQYLWPFQTLSNSRGHRTIEFPRNSLEVGNSLPAQMSIEERGFQGENRGDREDMVVFGRGSVANGQLLFEWKTSSWTKCTETCGGEGFQVRMARCLVRFYNTSQTVDSTLCEEAGLAVPMTRRKCGFDDCPEWVAYDWSSCENSKCVGFHKAVQRRLVKCEIGRNLTVDPNKCDSNKKPIETQDCHNDRCVGKWRVGTWSKCEAECGTEGNKYRIIQCVWYGTKKAAGTACKDLIKPPVMKHCLGPPCQIIKESTTACSDQSVFCPNVKAMNMCRIKRYKQQCCDSCKD